MTTPETSASNPKPYASSCLGTGGRGKELGESAEMTEIALKRLVEMQYKRLKREDLGWGLKRVPFRAFQRVLIGLRLH